MAIGMYEAFRSRETEDPISVLGNRAVLRYILDGSNVEPDIRAHLKNNAPVTYSDLVVQVYKVDPLAYALWQGEVTYGNPDDERSEEDHATDTAEWTFDTSGGTSHIDQSLEQVGKYSNHANGAEDYGGAIGVNGDGEPEGVDVVVPALTWTAKGWLPGTTVTTTYVKKLAELTGRTNDATFRDFDAGELLFMGAVGASRGRGDWEIVFRFLAGKNVANLVVGGITVTTKKAHNYLWVSFEKEVDGAAKKLCPKPRSVYVERVYEPGDFTELQIPAF